MKSGSGNTNMKLLLVHPYIQKQTSTTRLWLLAFFSFFIIIFLLTLLYTRNTIPSRNAAVAPVLNGGSSSSSSLSPTTTISHSNSNLPTSAINALLHYASRSNDSFHMSYGEMKSISDILRRCAPPCNFLVFALTYETLLWKIAKPQRTYGFCRGEPILRGFLRRNPPGDDVFDVQYMTKVQEAGELVAAGNECRPVQNLLFSDYKLGLNDLPNHVYDVDWDVILVDGPRGDAHEGPGRMSSIFTSAVLARSKKGGNPKTHVFVHDYYGDVERLCGDEFLCRENLVESNDWLASYVLDKMDKNSTKFCSDRKNSSVSSLS